jgi:hypothetical protein
MEDIMQLTLETWHRPMRAGQSKEIGMTRLEIDERHYRRLEEAERKLRESERKEAFVDLEQGDVDLQPPRKCGSLADCRIRVYLRDDDDSGHFHLVGRRSHDDALVYTNSVMVRTVAV